MSAMNYLKVWKNANVWNLTLLTSLSLLFAIVEMSVMAEMYSQAHGD